MKNKIIVFGIFFLLIIGNGTVLASDPPTIKNICHFPIDDVSDDYISKEITSYDSVIILATVYTYGESNPPKVVNVFYNDGSEHSLEMIYNWTYFCYIAEIGQFKTGKTVTYYIEATDTESQTTITDVYTFTVNDSEPSDPNEPPKISIISPKDNAIIKDATPTIKASFSDSDGIDIENLVLTVDGLIVNPITTSTSINYTPTFNMSYGVHIVILEVPDTFGETSISEWSFTIEKTESIPEQVDENSKEGPGFEIFFVILAITLIFLWKRKNRI